MGRDVGSQGWLLSASGDPVTQEPLDPSGHSLGSGPSHQPGLFAVLPTSPKHRKQGTQVPDSGRMCGRHSESELSVVKYFFGQRCPVSHLFLGVTLQSQRDETRCHSAAIQGSVCPVTQGIAAVSVGAEGLSRVPRQDVRPWLPSRVSHTGYPLLDILLPHG